MNQKIKDEAREKIAQRLRRLSVVVSDEEQEWLAIGEAAREAYRKEADQILSLSGEIDEVCDECEDGYLPYDDTGEPNQPVGGLRCPLCLGTGTIKKKWHIEIVEEE